MIVKHFLRPEALNPPSPGTILWASAFDDCSKVLRDRGPTYCKDTVPVEKLDSTLKGRSGQNTSCAQMKERENCKTTSHH